MCVCVCVDVCVGGLWVKVKDGSNAHGIDYQSLATTDHTCSSTCTNT